MSKHADKATRDRERADRLAAALRANLKRRKAPVEPDLREGGGPDDNGVADHRLPAHPSS